MAICDWCASDEHVVQCNEWLCVDCRATIAYQEILSALPSTRKQD